MCLPVKQSEKAEATSWIFSRPECRSAPSGRLGDDYADGWRACGYVAQRVGRGSVPGIVEGGASGWCARAAALQTGSPPSRGLHLIGSIRPVRSIRAVREDLTRSVGVDSCRSGVSPHRTQAPSRSWPPVTLPPLPATPFRRLSAPALPAPVQQGPVGDARPALACTCQQAPTPHADRLSPSG